MRAAANGQSVEAEGRGILLDALEPSGRTDLKWVEQLIAVGHELGGVDLPEADDEPATAADLRNL